MKGARSYAEDYVTSLDEQNNQLFDHIQGAQGAIEPFIDLEEKENGEEFDIDPRSGDCFTDFAQLPKPIPQFHSLIRENINHDMGGIKEGVMASPEMLVARGCRLGGLRACVVGS